MDTKRHPTRYPGVFFREVVRIGGAGSEKMFYIRFKKDGRLYEEKVGRQYGDQMSAAKAARIRADRIEGRRLSRKELREAERVKDKRWTIDRLARAYFESTDNNPAKSKKTLAADVSRYERFIRAGFSTKEPHEVLPLDTERLRRDLQRTKANLKGKHIEPRPLSPATIRAILVLFKRIINYGSKNGLSAALRFHVSIPKVSGVTIEDLNDEQTRRLLKAIEADTNIQVRGIMLLALYTGMRRGELFKLKWSHVDFDRRFIRIIGPKGGTDQTIPLNQAARKVLESHPRISEFVFPGEKGKQRASVQRASRRIRKAAGLSPTFRPLHGLRHAFASRLASSGQVDMYTLQKLLTHKSPVMTQRYAHLRDESLRRASELAGALVDNAVSGKGE
jgi:integrase